jgi:hypothetical protein
MTLSKVSRTGCDEHIINEAAISDIGLNITMIASAIHYVYQVLDAIDDKMVAFEEPRLSHLVELANLSSIVGNLFGRGVAISSDGKFERNKPHTYPDLLANHKDCQDCEIKIALETNKPKGHLVKPGPYITIRYVLSSLEGVYHRGKENRGDVVWLWEVRVGHLLEEHFSVSNTEGDSGKTAVINAAGMNNLSPVFIDMNHCPFSPNGQNYKKLASLMSSIE